MEEIKTYLQVNKTSPQAHFGISRMEEIYDKRNGQTDHPHRHAFYTVLLIEKGTGRHMIDFEEYPLANQQIFFISPGQVHQLAETQRSIGYSLVFDEQFLLQNHIPLRFIEDLNLFHDYGYSPPIGLSIAQYQRLKHYAEQICSYYASQEKFKEQAIGSLLKLMLIACNNFCSLPFDNPQQLEAGNSILREFKQLVEKQYKTWHASSAYAQALHISPDHLNRTVKSLIGKTAKEYIQSRITLGAKRLLRFSDLSSKEIGYELGFSEPANFSAFFKKCTGQSPSVFRKGN